MSVANPTEIQTYTGRYFNYADFKSESLDLEDIAHALSQICRYNGHCQKFYSVAQHTCLVHDLMKFYNLDPLTIFFGLTHDNAEAYLVDIPRPLKVYFEGTDFFQSYKNIENRIDVEFLKLMGFEEDNRGLTHDIIKFYDNWALLLEQKYLMKETTTEWSVRATDFPDEPDFVRNFFRNKRFMFFPRDWKHEYLIRLFNINDEINKVDNEK